MAIRIKPKAFGPINVRFSKDGALLYDGEHTDVGAATPHGTPVDLLLASLGACIVKSLAIAAEQRRQALTPFTVQVSGTKAADLPNRLGSVEIRVIGPLTDDEAVATALLQHAKSICTVSNTLNCAIALELERLEDRM